MLAHARTLLNSHESGATKYLEADLRDTGTILAQAAEVLDFTKPVAVTLVAILHVIPDSDDPHAIVATLLDAVPAGSYLVVSHMGSDLIPAQTQQEMSSIGDRVSQQQYWNRSREQVTRFFAGTELVEPGLTRVEDWHPEPGSTSSTHTSALWGAVGRKN